VTNFPLTLPAGSYRLGDISLFLDDEVYAEIFGAAYDFRDGQYQIGQEWFASVGTQDQDFQSSTGYRYLLDLFIGLVSVHLTDPNRLKRNYEDSKVIHSSTPIKVSKTKNSVVVSFDGQNETFTVQKD